MKYGPCRKCLVAPCCTSMCEKKMYDINKRTAKYRKKPVSKVTLEEFLSHLKATEGVTITRIEVIDGTIERTKRSS